MSAKSFKKIYLGLAILCWVLLTLSNLVSYFSSKGFFDPSLSDFFANYLLCLFILFSFLYFKIEIGSKNLESKDDYLWRVFITGISCILISLFIRFFIATGFLESLLLYSIFFHVNLGLLTIYIAGTFYVWKKLILYHKSNRTNIIWHIFEYCVLFSILSSFFIFDIRQSSFYIYISPLILLAAFLSFHLKWIALLNYKKKIRSIVLMAFILLVSIVYFQQIYEHQLTNEFSIDLWDNLFVLGMLIFIAFYALTCILVLMFHLPTSSVFEKKIEEVKIFQKLNQQIQEGDTEEHIYELMLDSGINAVDAHSGWLEIVDEKGNIKAFIHQNVDKIDVFELKKVLRKNHINAKNDPYYINSFKGLLHTTRVQDLPYKSAILLPLTSNNQHLGTLVLIKNKNSGFDRNATDVLYTFVNQASLAIKNYRLVSEALQNQRYRETVKIAQEVQKRLLPTNFLVNDNILIHAFSKAADDVGGDYYDLFPFPNKNKLAVTIGDVSGNGTTASFNMAQMKGIFQSLIRLNFPVDEFMYHANQAIGSCLESKSFITLSVFVVDTLSKTFEHSRAGHCQAIFYNAETNTLQLLDQKGLGLGIVRNEGYKNHIEKKTYSYKTNDKLILYTDGIIEATNKAGEEFGENRLIEVLKENIHENPKVLSGIVLEKLYNFSEKPDLNDDYSIIILKFV